MKLSSNPSVAATPVLVLGGEENTLSIARSFGRRKIPVIVSALQDCFAFKSHYCSKSLPIPRGENQRTFWTSILLGTETPNDLAGAVIFAGNDEAVEFIAANREQLARRFIVDDALPDLSLSMLSKLKTLELARNLGCATPAFHRIQSLQDVALIEDGLLFPTMVKPVHSHLFHAHFPNSKYLIAFSKTELHDKVQQMLSLGLTMIVTEIIPGADDRQSAYFCYRTRQGRILFEYTHQIVRRFPKNSGAACLTISRHLPQTATTGRAFMQGTGFAGMGHVEFKFDERDQQLKIIECNPRTSAAQAVVSKSGLDMPWLIYSYLLKGEVPSDTSYQEGVRRWWVILDILAFLELRKLREITVMQWLRSIKGPPLVFPYFCLDDPMPFFHKAWKHLSHTIGKRVGFHGKRKSNPASRTDRLDAKNSGKSRL